jgi:eukaryotic-like serine/threonine-protein kinase
MSPYDEEEGADDPELARRVAEAHPDGDRLTHAVGFARVALALFGHAEPVMVGRYQLDRPLGRGGGGLVFVARDPELQRDVAIKLIRCASARHRRSALAEARALAKLSHPNVVPVHDIGETAEHVYLVMELLRGESLREYAARPGRRLRDLVVAYRQAASGLAAAHTAGLIHRDFKPDNAVFGEDGRLRVVDFGLAIDSDEEEVAPFGTPRYMAPEQHAGAALDSTVDQYAVGVSLREAVAQCARAEPAWLARVIARATAEQPRDRYPSMEALSRALGRDPRTLWSRRAIIVAPSVVAAAAFGLGRTASTGPGAMCDGGADALAAVWTSERVHAAAVRIEQLGTAFAAAVAPEIRQQAHQLGADWIAAHRASCVAHQRSVLTDELYDRSTVCLARSRTRLAEAIQLLETTEVTRLDRAISALAVAGGSDQCTDPIALAAETGALATAELRAIDEQIEAAAIHVRAATMQAPSLAEQAAVVARASGNEHLLARALLVLGHGRMMSDLSRAVAPLHEAMKLALENGQDELMIEAYARLAYARGRTVTGDRQRVLDGLELVEIIGLRTREHGAFARALLANNVGSVAMLEGDFARAKERFGRAVAEAQEVRGPGAVELVTVLSNLALLTADRAERTRLFAAALAGVTAAVGPDHPDALWKQLQMITDQDDARVVIADLALICRRAARLHPENALLLNVCAFELAWQASAVGDADRVHEGVRWIRPGQRGAAPQLVAAYGRLAERRPSQAEISDLARLADVEASKISRLGWLQDVLAADTDLALAAAARAAGDLARASGAAARAIEHLERVRGTTGVTGGHVQRRLAWAHELRVRGQ